MRENKKKLPQLLQDNLQALKSPEGYLYAGLPKFMGLFGRDALISSWQLLTYDSSIAAHSLLALARLQGKKVNPLNGEEPGKIIHEFYPKNVPDEWFKQEKQEAGWLKKETPFYFSVDSTPLFIVLAAKYYQETKDKPLLKKLGPHLEAAFSWLLRYGLIDNFLRYQSIQPGQGLISQSWKDGIGSTLEQIKGPVAIVEVQGYAWAAFEALSQLESFFDNPELKTAAQTAAERLKLKFHQAFFMPREQFYCLGLDGDNRQIPLVTSNPGHLLFSRLIDEARADLVVKRLFQKDMWTPYGIRTDSTLSPDFDPLSYQRGAVWPHDNWIIAQGLRQRGYHQEYRLIKEALLRAFEKLKFLPEYYGVSLNHQLIYDRLETPPCYPQAWATGALINLLITGD
jgi:glycogen debranching enzyme